MLTLAKRFNKPNCMKTQLAGAKLRVNRTLNISLIVYMNIYFKHKEKLFVRTVK